MTTLDISTLPRLVPSVVLLREEIERRAYQYGDASANASVAWTLYSEAIDYNPEQVKALGAVAEQAEADKVHAYYCWQEAKRNLLAIQN